MQQLEFDFDAPVKLSTVLEVATTLAKEVEELRPKANSWRRVMDAQGTVCISDFAKALGFGPNQFFALLRSHKILFNREGVNLPYQEFISRGYFKVKETSFYKNGHNKPSKGFQTRITSRGQEWLIEKFASRGLAA